MSSAVKTVERAVDQTRSSFFDLGAQALRLVKSLRAVEIRGMDSMLHRIGLQRRDKAPRAAVWFAAGAIAAGAVVFILAPESGKKLRDRVTQLWESRGPHGAEPPEEAATGQELAH